MSRTALPILALMLAGAAQGAGLWTPSVEFPWSTIPESQWEQQLVQLKSLGIRHFSLVPGEPGRRARVIQIVRRLHLEADIEGPTGEELRPLTREHGGPLTNPPPGLVRISVLDPQALVRARGLLESGAGSPLWTDVGQAQSGILRREAQLALFWNTQTPLMNEIPGAAVRVLPAPEALTVRQFGSTEGVSLVSVINRSALPFRGDLKGFYAGAKRSVVLPDIQVPAHDALFLPLNLTLPGAFAAQDHLIYATAELNTIEYENGVLAMEFHAPSGGEVILKLSAPPEGPLLAGGKPGIIDWDDAEHRARLIIPPSREPTGRVRIGLAIHAPDVTGFFPSAKVLLIGETNHVTAQFSSEATASRSRIRVPEGLSTAQHNVNGQPLELLYDVTVPATAVHGDQAELAIEADGIQLGHSMVRLLTPAQLRFEESSPVEQRAGRGITVSIVNNAEEIRNFHLELQVPGIEFLPSRIDVPVGASASRDVTFRVIARDADVGTHTGTVTLSGPAVVTGPIEFVVTARN